MFNDPTVLFLGGVTLVVIVLIMMKEQKARNFKEFATKYDIKDVDEKPATKDSQSK